MVGTGEVGADVGVPVLILSSGPLTLPERGIKSIT